MIQNARIVGVFVNPKDYHAASNGERGKPDFVVTRSMLKAFDPCPHRWLAGAKQDDTDSMAWGTVVDALLLCPDHVDSIVAVHPETYPAEKGKNKPWHNGADYCRDWSEAHKGLTIVSAATMAKAKQAAKVMLANDAIRAFISDMDAQVWVAAEWRDKASGITITIQTLIDIVPRKGPAIGDLKTCDDAAIEPWQKACARYWYHAQAAMNLDLYNAATGQERDVFRHVVSESDEPFECVPRMLSENMVEIGRVVYRNALKKYCECLASGHWPGFENPDYQHDGWSIVDPDTWTMRQYEKSL